MKEKCTTLDFFLGSNTENGFFSHFSQLQDINYGIRPIILKGGPGTGKSSIMKKVANDFFESENIIENIHCSSDPDSLDCVILHNKKRAVLDGTSPHIMEAKYPLALENIVNLLDCGNENKVKENLKEIYELNNDISMCHKSFCNMLKFANSMINTTRLIINKYVNFNKLERNALRISQKELKRTYNNPKEHIRMISAFTPNGLITYQDTVIKLCKKVWVINDEYRVCSPILLQILREEALDKGYEIYTCYSAFNASKEIDALLIPQINLAFVCSNKYLDFSKVNPYKIMNVTRFIDKTVFQKYKQRLSFYRKTIKQLLDEGILHLKKAKSLHDELEKYYIKNMDFNKLNKKYKEIFTLIKD